MKTTLVVLPEEVKELAVRVPESKQKEVQEILNQVFAGTADWERQVDAIEVKNINDTMSIQLADVARKNAKTARLHAEKIFDSKREQVQQRMQDDKLEDSLWLKSKQIMQLKFKSIEEKAEWKANFVKRYEAEQKELRTQARLLQVQKFNPELNRMDIENLSDEMFNIFLSGIEKVYNDRIEAERKAEAERIAKEKAEKEEQERIKKENEQLRKEAEAKEKQLLFERQQAQKELEKAEAKRLAERKAQEEKERKESEANELKLKKEREERQRAEAQLRASQEAEIKLI